MRIALFCRNLMPETDSKLHFNPLEMVIKKSCLVSLESHKDEYEIPDAWIAASGPIFPQE